LPLFRLKTGVIARHRRSNAEHQRGLWAEVSMERFEKQNRYEANVQAV